MVKDAVSARLDMLDLFLIMTLGFLGSFGHCLGMCGPITAAFSLSQQEPSSENAKPSWQQQLYFHGLLNLGRISSYALVGAGIGALGSVLVASGQMAGIGSELRHCMALITGGLLIWFGLVQVSPELLPRLPLLHPILQGGLHNRLSSAMVKLSLRSHWWTPALLGLVWGLIPCGFLYAAQIKAAETGNLWWGGATMLAFGIGTLPTMLGVGVSAGIMSSDRRSQLFRMGGWVMLVIGVLTLLRTGDSMVDYTGYAALICLIMALIARPISRIWSFPLRYRRALGVGAFILALAHTAHMLDHVWEWNLAAFAFMVPQHQWGIIAGTLGLGLITPAALTSFNRAQAYLGQSWRYIHLLAVPALVLCVIHCVLIGSSYLGSLQFTWTSQLNTAILTAIAAIALLIRWRWFWSFFAMAKFYVPPTQVKSSMQSNR